MGHKFLLYFFPNRQHINKSIKCLSNVLLNLLYLFTHYIGSACTCKCTLCCEVISSLQEGLLRIELTSWHICPCLRATDLLFCFALDALCCSKADISSGKALTKSSSLSIVVGNSSSEWGIPAAPQKINKVHVNV